MWAVRRQVPVSLAAGLVAVTLSMAGCASSEPAPTSSPSPVDSVAAKQAEVVSTYFDGLSAGDVSGFKEARTVSAPGSPARVFAQHQKAMSTPTGDISGRSWQTAVSVDDSSVSWSTSTMGRPQEDQEFTEFEFDDADRVIGWTVDDTSQLGEQVVNLTDKLSGNGITVRGGTAYLSGNDELQVTYSARGGDGTVTAGPYVNKGKATKGVHSPFQLEVRPKGSATGWSLYSKSAWGGAVELKLDYNTTVWLAVGKPPKQ